MDKQDAIQQLNDYYPTKTELMEARGESHIKPIYPIGKKQHQHYKLK